MNRGTLRRTAAQRRLGEPAAEPATIRSTPTTDRSAGRLEADAQPGAEAHRGNRGIARRGEAAPSSGPSRPAELRGDAGICARPPRTGPEAGAHASAAPTTAGDPVPRSGPGELGPALSSGAGLDHPPGPLQGHSAAQGALSNEVGLDPPLTVLSPPCPTQPTALGSVSCRLSPRIGADGYGLGTGGEAAHRVAYREANGAIPAGTDIHHWCGVKSCEEPAHLVALSRLDHLQAQVWPALRRWRAGGGRPTPTRRRRRRRQPPTGATP